MTLVNTYTELTKDEAESLRTPSNNRFTVEVRPPRDEVPVNLVNFTKNIYEPQTKWLGIKNVSPITTLEIRRNSSGQIKIQFSTSSKRMERKIRTGLNGVIPDVELTDGVDGVPAVSGDSVGGGFVKTGRRDWYPLQKEFDYPPLNHVIDALHKHAMMDSRFILQISWQPNAGKSLRNWWWTQRAHKRKNSLNKDKENLWGSRSPTSRERSQADEIENKAKSPRSYTSIKLLVIGAGNHTPSRVKEIGSILGVMDNLETGQNLQVSTLKAIRRKPFVRFCNAVAERQLYPPKFQASIEELAPLISVPDRQQENLPRAQP